MVATTLLLAPLLQAALPLAEATPPAEEDYYRIVEYEPPAGVVLEVGGLAVLPDGRPILSTRRGEVWVVDDAYTENPADARFTKYAEGLQEPLGLLVHDNGWIYVVQRGELSRMRDVDGDDRIDELETVCDAWSISGNYHEYNFGPRLDADGNFWITTNKPFGGEPFGRQHWRGFAVRITPEGEFLPTCSGLRSPAGVEIAPWGDVFYTDNQGEWCGMSKLSHLDPGTFHGHPHGIGSCDLEEWPYDHPGDPPNGVPMPDVAAEMEDFRLPAVWFPYEKMGKSPAGLVWDTTNGGFGPFPNQAFVTDQHHASLMRVQLEQVNGVWQGACFPFRYGFPSGTLRVAWAPDDSMLVGMTNRGWGSRGHSTDGLARVEWTGAVPFEIREMVARPDGFELRFTRPVDPETAGDPASYAAKSWTYLLSSNYGSPPTDEEPVRVVTAAVSDDQRSVRLTLDHLRAGYVHEVVAAGVRATDGNALLHDDAYYTLVEVPEHGTYLGREIARTMHWTGGPWLLRGSREEEENTALLLDNLGLGADSVVADLGCGNGYLALQMAERLDGDGKVLCVELQPEYFPTLEKRAAELGVENYELIRATATDPRLPDDSCDLVVMLDVYHELGNPDLVLANVADALREGGRLALVEFRAEDPDVPIKPLHKMTEAQMVKELESNGWDVDESFEGLPWQHLMFFTPPGR